MRAARCSVVVLLFSLSTVPLPGLYSPSVVVALADEQAPDEPHVAAVAAKESDHEAVDLEQVGEGKEEEEVEPPDADRSDTATEEANVDDNDSVATVTNNEENGVEGVEDVDAEDIVNQDEAAAAAASGDMNREDAAQTGDPAVDTALENRQELADKEELTEEDVLRDGDAEGGVDDGDSGESNGGGDDADEAGRKSEGWGEKVKSAEVSLKGALKSYDRLLREHYLKMSFVQATALGVVGDSIAQHLERRWHPGQRFDFTRSAHAGVLNMVIDGFFTPRWYNLVDNVNEERTLPVAFVKALAASTVYSPFANGLFLAGARTLRYGPKTRFNWAEWRRQLMICTVRDFEMWPPLHILSFWLLPKHWRPLASHMVGVALLAVISRTGLTDAALPLGQRTAPLLMRWTKTAARAIGNRVGARDRRATATGPPAATRTAW